jgi:Effector-associated domain 11/Beta/Gamma crystallin
MMTKQEIRNLISEDRLDEAINILLKVTEHDAHLYQQVGTMSANYRSYKKRAATGQLTTQEQNQGTATIANGLLYVVDEIWKNGDIRVPPTTPRPLEPTPKSPYLRYVVGGISTLLLALGVWQYAPIPAYLESNKTQPVVFKLHNESGESAVIPNITGKIILYIRTLNYRDTANINEDNNAVFEKVPLKALGVMAEATLDSKDYNSIINGKLLRIESTIDYSVIRKSIPKVTPPTEKPTNRETSAPSDPPKVVYVDPTKVVLFEKLNYKGEVLELNGESNSLNELNDKVSSIKIPKGSHVVLYDQNNSGSGSGKAIILRESTNDLTPYDFNNMASFAEVKKDKFTPAPNSVSGEVWVHGHFELRNGKGEWRSSSWVTAPKGMNVWREGNWITSSNGKKVWKDGYWDYDPNTPIIRPSTTAPVPKPYTIPLRQPVIKNN